MQISYSNQASFKSVYPVYTWVAVGENRYKPVGSKDLTKTITKGVITILNKEKNSEKNKKISDIAQNFINFIKAHDSDYRRLPCVRSYYHKDGGLRNNRFEPIAYILTGEDANYFDKQFAQKIGIAEKKLHAKHQSVEEKKKAQQEKNKAIRDYQNEGFRFICDRIKGFKHNDGNILGLHIKIKPELRANSELKLRSPYERVVTCENFNNEDVNFYRIEDYRFLPEKGPVNPFVRLGYVK